MALATLSGLRVTITCHKCKNEVYHTTQRRNNTLKSAKINTATTLLQHIAEMSTAAKLLSPFFAVLEVITSITSAMNHVFCTYICYFTAI